MESEPGHPHFLPYDWPFVRGRQLEELRRLDTELRRLAEPFHIGGADESSLGAHGSRGDELSVTQAIRGKITGQYSSTSPWYSFEAITFYNDSTTLATGSWTFTYAGGSNDSITFNAAELNLNTAVPLNAIVTLWPMEDGQSWGFYYTGGSSGNESINYNNDTINFNNSSITFNNDTFGIVGKNSFSGSGYFVFNMPFEICGFQFWCCKTFTLISASNDNLDLRTTPGPATVYNLTTPGSNSIITGIVPAQLGGVNAPQVIALVNVDAGGKTITLNNNSGSSLAANRILLPPTYGSAVTLAVNDSIVLWWDGCTSSEWRVLACTVDVDTATSPTVHYNSVTGTLTTLTLSGTFQQIPNAVLTVPAGLNWLAYRVPTEMFTTGGGDQLEVQLFDSTSSVVVPGSDMQWTSQVSNSATNTYNTLSVSTPYNLAASATVYPQARLIVNSVGATGQIQLGTVFSYVNFPTTSFTIVNP